MAEGWLPPHLVRGGTASRDGHAPPKQGVERRALHTARGADWTAVAGLTKGTACPRPELNALPVSWWKRHRLRSQRCANWPRPSDACGTLRPLPPAGFGGLGSPRRRNMRIKREEACQVPHPDRVQSCFSPCPHICLSSGMRWAPLTCTEVTPCGRWSVCACGRVSRTDHAQEHRPR